MDALSLRGASPSRTTSDAPLTRLRLKAGLSIPELAAAFSVTTATVSRWCSGDRDAPAGFVAYLHAAAAGKPSEAMAAQEAFRQERKAEGPTFAFRRALPVGVSREEALRTCEQAIDRLARRSRP